MNQTTTTWRCDACAEADGGSGLPCTLTSDFLHPDTELMCPVSGEVAEFIEVTD